MNSAVSPPTVSDLHVQYLTAHAISADIIGLTRPYVSGEFSADVKIFSQGDMIVFPWLDGNLLTFQQRPWPEPEGGLPEGEPKYRWEPGKPLHLWAIRPLDPGRADGPVIIAEGTKQSLAVASWAPPEYAVYGMPGCDMGWDALLRMARLSRFEGRKVFIMLDADASDNLNVYEGGEKLAGELELEGAIPGFVPSPAWGKAGIDDYLAGIEPERRTERIIKLLAKAGPKPADRKPAHRKVSDPALPDTGGRPLIIVNRDRLEVITAILGCMMQRWNGRDLFCYGDVLARLRVGYETDGQVISARTEPLNKDSFLAWLSACVATYKYRKPGLASPGEYEPGWPDRETVAAILARGDEFAPLKRLSRTPFARKDGTICAKNGYDDATQSLLITGNSGMDRLDIPDEPGQAEAAAAARYLLDDWLGDMPWRDEASRANALGLALTPLIRGLVPLVPLAVISGLQPGVGKNLLADCISLMISGEVTPTTPWLADDDDENRKQITSVFRDGKDLIVFDEAHQIGGHSLTRAITSITYSDRILGLSQQASFPNQVTWIALGNQVQVSADMARRAYSIDLHPDVPDPENRPESAFTHPDLRGWTTDRRPELITAALTVIRAWFAAGKPAYPRGQLMGSFEPWDKTLSGMLGYAGVTGFLSGLTERRTERDTSGGYWTEHLAWLAAQFGTAEFTVLDVKVRAIASAGAWDGPPSLDDPETRGFARNLGAAYSRIAGRWFGGYRVVRMGFGHRTVRKWWVQPRDAAQEAPSNAAVIPGPGGVISISHRDPSIPPVSQMLPEQAGRDQEGSNPVVSGAVRASGGSIEMEGWRDGEGFSSPDIHAGARAHARARVRTREGENDSSIRLYPSAPLPGFSLGFDLETDDASRLFLVPRGEFIRLAGLTGPSGGTVIASVPDLMAMIGTAEEAYGHNIMGFDGLALAWHHGMDWMAFAAKARDTELIARQAYPPRSREHGSEDKLDLDHVAAMLGMPGKTDDLKRLARKHGGYGLIPPDDPEYRSYLIGDLDATRGVARHLHHDDYTRREHRLAAIAGQMSLSGFRVDTGLLAGRESALSTRKAQALELLHEGWGLPLSKTVMRGRGAAKHEVDEPFDSPLASGPGKAWLEQQFTRYQVPDPPRTPKSGELATGADDLRGILTDPATPADLRAMLTLMGIVTGTRTVYQTAREHIAADGRVHPRISFRQASGRWSVTKPGLTVFGKHGGRHHERDIFLPDDEDHVILTCDLSQVDMRAMAGHSQDPAYMAMFEPGRDPHSEIAGQVYGDPHGGQCPPGCALRQSAKAIGHGWNYGLGAKRMIASGMDADRVYTFTSGMETRFPQLIAWRENIRAMGKAGMILDNGFGRRMMAEPSRAYTVAPALMGQGGARDIMCECLLRLPPELYPFLRVMVHDEIVLSVPAAAAAEIGHILKEAMTWTWQDVPILCDLSKPGKSWGDVSDK